jgi:23S rRNA (cytosine1962-C5)-methyltransferase
MDAENMATRQKEVGPLLLSAAGCPAAGHAVINAKAVQRLRAGHPWIYVGDVVQRPAAPAGLVEVVDHAHTPVGSALYSPRSKIMLRMVTHRQHKGFSLAPAAVVAEITLRVRQALERRRRTLDKFSERDAYRLVHGEADHLPGIFADKYSDCIVLQSTCAGSDAWVEAVGRALYTLVRPRLIYLRNDAKARAHEGLTQQSQILFGDAAQGFVTTYHEGTLPITVDLQKDQKTGGFLDQADNHVKARRYARGRALDLCTYHGGFALQLSAGASSCLAYDLSESALARARHNAAQANLTNIDFQQGDLFDVLPALQTGAERFDTLVLDPPAFASTRKTLDAAMRAYKDVNRRAMGLAAPNSILITCSCSGRVAPGDFDAMLQAAGAAARRPFHVVERLGAAADHPVLSGVPETEYLKVRFLLML